MTALQPEIAALCRALHSDDGKTVITAADQLHWLLERSLAPVRGVDQDGREYYELAIASQYQHVYVSFAEAKEVIDQAMALVLAAPDSSLTTHLLPILWRSPPPFMIGYMLLLLHEHRHQLSVDALHQVVSLLGDCLSYTNGRRRLFREVLQAVRRSDPTDVVEELTFSEDWHLSDRAFDVFCTLMLGNKNARSQRARAFTAPTDKQELERLLTLLFDDMWTHGRLHLIDEVIAMDAVNHHPLLDWERQGPDGARDGWAGAAVLLRLLMPGFAVDIRHWNLSFASGGLVKGEVTLVGRPPLVDERNVLLALTHRPARNYAEARQPRYRPVRGIPRPQRWYLKFLVRAEAGRIVETWLSCWWPVAELRQAGFLPGRWERWMETE